MDTSGPSQDQRLSAWNILVPYVVLVAALLGLASHIHVDFLMIAGGFVMVYALGELITQWIVQVGGAKLKDDERLPFAIVSGAVLIALIGSASFVIWPPRALLLTRILLGLVGTLLCIMTLVERVRTLGSLPFFQMIRALFPVMPHVRMNTMWPLLLIILIAFLGRPQEGAERYTELFLADSTVLPCADVDVSRYIQCIDVQIGVINKEKERTEYALVVYTPLSTMDLASFILEDGDLHQSNVRFSAQTCEQGGEIEVILYRNGFPLPYRSIHFSCELLSSGNDAVD